MKKRILLAAFAIALLIIPLAAAAEDEELANFGTDTFRIELAEKDIGGLSEGGRSTTKATLFNIGQAKLKCLYIIPGTNEEQSITDGLSPGSSTSFNIIFFVPQDCREPCGISAHVICYDKQAATIAGETDVSFDLWEIQTTGTKVLGYGILILIVAAVIFIIIKVIRHFKKREGYKSPETEEKVKRKLSAIMFTDMKGYSAEVGKDEEKTLKKVWRYEKAMKNVIKENDGRIVKTIGDAIMGDFDSAVNAVNAAMEIQRMLEKEDIMIRIGIHLGEVIHKGGDIFGDGVNIASRIESICEPGEVYISEDVFKQVKGKISAEFEDLGKQRLKNIETHVRTYKVI